SDSCSTGSDAELPVRLFYRGQLNPFLISTPSHHEHNWVSTQVFTPALLKGSRAKAFANTNTKTALKAFKTNCFCLFCSVKTYLLLLLFTILLRKAESNYSAIKR
ncbi:MAG TPA: hypothetical protein ACN46L_06420, partial [Prochlorococcus sp.]